LKGPSFHIEKHLITQFQAGNEYAFEIIFHRTKGKLKGFLRRVLPFDEDVENMLQETYLKLWENRNTLDPDRNIETFIYAIARNMVIDIMRKRLHKQKYLEDLYNQLQRENRNSLDTIATVEYSELEKKIFDLIEQLPERRKLVFKLSRIDGLTYKEIAQELNISENTVDTQIRQALLFLRNGMNVSLGLLITLFLHS